MSNARCIGIAMLLAFALAAAWLWLSKPGLHLDRTFESPDGHYRVEVWRHPQPFMMPGQSGDAPGVARVDASGNMLAEVPVEIVQLVEDVDGRTATPASR